MYAELKTGLFRCFRVFDDNYEATFNAIFDREH